HVGMVVGGGTVVLAFPRRRYARRQLVGLGGPVVGGGIAREVLAERFVARQRLPARVDRGGAAFVQFRPLRLQFRQLAGLLGHERLELFGRLGFLDLGDVGVGPVGRRIGLGGHTGRVL